MSLEIGTVLKNVTFEGNHLDATAVLKNGDGQVRIFPQRGSALPTGDALCDVQVTGLTNEGSVAFVKTISRFRARQVLPPAYAWNWRLAPVWPINCGQPDILVDIREGKATQTFSYWPEDARLRGCPNEVLKRQAEWVSNIFNAFKAMQYHPLEGELVSLVFTRPEQFVGYEDRRDLVDLVNPHWVEAQGELVELGEKLLMVSVAGPKGVAKARLLAQMKKAEVYACGHWGNGISPISFRQVMQDWQVCGKLALPQPLVISTPDGLPQSYTDLLNRCRPVESWIKPTNWPGTFVCNHRGWRNLTGEVLTCQWRNNPVICKVGIDTNLTAPVLEGEDTIFLPWNWGFMAIGAQDLLIDDLEVDNGQVYELEKGAVFCAPYGKAITASIGWMMPNGEPECFNGRIEILPDGYRAIQTS